MKPGTQFKLLGVTIDENLTSQCHIDEICKKAVQRANALRRLNKCLSLEFKLKIINHSFLRISVIVALRGISVPNLVTENTREFRKGG